MTLPTRQDLDIARARADSLLRQMIAAQEELDWRCYRLYGLLPTGATDLEHPNPPEVTLGQRAFEIVLARRIAAGTETTTWFERHGSTPITEIPAHWPEDYRQIVRRRIEAIERDRTIAPRSRPPARPVSPRAGRLFAGGVTGARGRGRGMMDGQRIVRWLNSSLTFYLDYHR